MLFRPLFLRISLAAVALSIATLSFSSFAEALYRDVASTSWSAKYITVLSDQGIIKGYSDGTFRPEKEINRVEFLKLVVASAGLELSDGESITFPDTDKKAWYAPYVEVANRTSIARGYDDGRFRPEATVNRAEALKMLLRLKLDMDTYTFDTVSSLQLRDVKAGDWYGPYVNAAMRYHILDQLITNTQEIIPGKALTRADAAYLLYQFRFADTEFSRLPLRSMQSSLLPLPSTSRSPAFADAYTLFTLGGASLIDRGSVEEKVIIELGSGIISTAAFSAQKTRVLDDLKQKIDPALQILFQKYQVKTLTALQTTGFGSGTMFELRVALGSDTSAFLHELLRLPNVMNASINTPQYPLVLPNDPYLHSRGAWWSHNGYDDQWGLKKINAPEAWEITTGSPELIVAIIDTGVEKSHPELKNRLWHNLGEISNNRIDDDKNGFVDDVEGWNFIDSTNDIQDGNGHGTHIAGIIGAETDNAVGIAGINAHSKLMILKVFDEEGAGDSITTARAIKYAVDNGAKIINLSLAGESTKSTTGKLSYDEQMLLYAYQKGVTIITAAGNQAMDITDISPANYPYTIAVSATEPYDTPADAFSNFGKKIDVSAPGADILSTFAPDGYLGKLGNMQSQMFMSSPYTPTLQGKKYAVLQGTSMAAGFVTGTVSLLLSQYPSLQPETVRTILRLSAHDINDMGFDVQTGMGRLDAKKALNIAPNLLHQQGYMNIISPEKESVLSGVQDIVVALASERSISAWKLSLRTEGKDTVLSEGKTLPTNGVLMSLDTKKNADGPIKLVLESQWSDGTSTVYEGTYVVENISIREKNDPMTSSGETLLSGSSVLPLSSLDVTWSTGVGAHKEGVKTTVSSQGYLVRFTPSTPLAEGTIVRFTLRFKTLSGVEMTKTVQRKVTAERAQFSFSDTTKSCSQTLSCRGVGENGYFIEIGEKKQKVLVLANHSEVYALTENGKNLPGWPKKLTTYISQAPLFVTIKNVQGKKVSAFVLMDEQGTIHAWDINGTGVAPLDGLSVNKTGGYLSALDKDGDGVAEFLLMSKTTGGSIGMLSANGTYVTGWPYVSTFAGLHAPSAGDLTGDRTQEIFFGDDMGIVYGFTAQGKPLSGWPRQIKGKIMEVHLSDLNKDGKQEIIIVSQYLGDNKTPKVGLFILNANGTLYAQGDQEFSGIVPTGNALRIYDGTIVLALDGYSPLEIRSKLVLLDTQGRLVSQVENTLGHILWGPMMPIVDTKKTVSLLTRNEDQALLLEIKSGALKVIGELPKAKETELHDTPLCRDTESGCIPLYIIQSGAGISTSQFEVIKNTKSIQSYFGYNPYRNYNADEVIKSPSVTVPTSKSTDQSTASLTSREGPQSREYTLNYTGLPDLKDAATIRFISRTSVSDPFEFPLTRIAEQTYLFTLPLSVEGGIYDVQVGDRVQGYGLLPELFTVDALPIEMLSVAKYSPSTIAYGQKTVMTITGTGFSPYHQYAIHVGTTIIRDGIEVLNSHELRVPIMMTTPGSYTPWLEDISQGAMLALSSPLKVAEILPPKDVKFSKTTLAGGQAGFITIVGNNLPESAQFFLQRGSQEFALDTYQTRRSETGDIISVVVKYPVLLEYSSYQVMVKSGIYAFELGGLSVMDPSTFPKLVRSGPLPTIQKVSSLTYVYSGALLSGEYHLEISSDTFLASFPTTLKGNKLTAQVLLPAEGSYLVRMLNAQDQEVAIDPLTLVLGSSASTDQGIEVLRFAPSVAQQGDTMVIKILGKGMNELKMMKVGEIQASTMRILSVDEAEGYFVFPRDMKEGMYSLDVEDTNGHHTMLKEAFQITKRLSYVQPVLTNVTPLVTTPVETTIEITGSGFPNSMKASMGSSIQSQMCSVLTTKAVCMFDLRKVEVGRYPLRFQDIDTGVVYDTGSVIEVKSY